MENNIKSMLRFLGALLLLCVLQYNVFAQTVETIELNTQSQIDSLSINYPSITLLDYMIMVSGNDITNLNGFLPFSKIKGLSIENCDSLNNLQGLNNIDSLGGIIISDNDNLINFIGLGSLVIIKHKFLVMENDLLMNFEGLDSLKTIGTELRLDNNPSLINLNGLEEVENQYEPNYLLLIEIYDNNNLENLNGLQNLNTLIALYCINNNSLVSLFGLENVEFIGIPTISPNSNLCFCSIPGICSIMDPNTAQQTYSFGNSTGCDSWAEIYSQCPQDISEENLYKNFISIFPNPAENEIFISSFEEILSYEIYSITGKEIKRDKYEGQISVNELTSGMYFIKVSTEHESAIVKFIKN